MKITKEEGEMILSAFSEVEDKFQYICILTNEEVCLIKRIIEEWPNLKKIAPYLGEEK